MISVYHINLGLTDFAECWELQKQVHLYKQSRDCPDLVITTEHNHVYTLGRTGDRNNLLLDERSLKEKNISYYEIDRGGDLTYHGPGQLVCYPLFDLKHFYLDTHKYLRDLEEAVILTLKNYGIKGERDEGLTGVWVGNEKICAIGIKVSKWITMHGLAFNINNELKHFAGIIPCGILHKGITSLKELYGAAINMEELNDYFIKSLDSVFNIEIQSVPSDRVINIFELEPDSLG